MTTAELGALLKGLAPAIRDYIVTSQKALSDRLTAIETQDLIPGPEGKPGAKGERGSDGKDGLGFDDLTVTHDGERSFTFTFTKGAAVKSFPFVLPVPIYRGVWRDGQMYQRCDNVTRGGSVWIKTGDQNGKPGEADSGWTLAVKHGDDGKSIKGEKGDKGEPGRDMAVQRDQQGNRWDGPKF